MRHTTTAISVLACALATPSSGQTLVDLKRQTKNVDFSEAGSTKPFRMGADLPPTCATGEAFFKTSAPAGENWYACTGVNVWTLQSGASGLPPAAGHSGKVLSNDGSAAGWLAIGGDASGTPDALVVRGIQGRRVGVSAPTDGQILRWNAGSDEWQPFPAPSQPALNFSHTFTAETTVTIPGSTHMLNTANLIVDCYDDGSPAAMVEPEQVTVDATTYDVTVDFTTAQSGRCVLNGSGAGSGASTLMSNSFAAGTTQTFQGALVATGAERTAPVRAGIAAPAGCVQGDLFFDTDAEPGANLHFCTAADTWTQMTGSGGEAVESVFGRSGAVTAQAGDYAFAQISGTVADSQVANGINAAKIGAGTVSNTIFGYLANVSGDVQAQLNAKAASAHGHAAGGDASGDIASLTVSGLQNRAVSSSAPADGQALVWSALASAWQPGTVSGGSGGGASLASQLGDFGVVRSAADVLTVGAQCSAATPCNARFGNTVYSFTNSCTATITAGSGTAYVYVAHGGTLTIGHNLTVSASAGCLSQPNVTAFPADSVPLYTWTAVTGSWDAAGGTDRRAWLSAKGISPGAGVTTVETGGRTIVAVDTAVVPTYVSGSAVLNFGLIATETCQERTFTLTGATVNDAVAQGWPAALEAGLAGMMRVSSSNTISVRLCNVSGSGIDPASATFRATIVRGS